jgi:hypothetical protein
MRRMSDFVTNKIKFLACANWRFMLKGVIGLQMGKCLYGEKSNLKTPRCVTTGKLFQLKISLNYLFFACATNELNYYRLKADRFGFG